MSPAALAWEQFRLERKLFWRSPSAAFFSIVLPLMLLVLTASVFAGNTAELDVIIPGIAGMSVMATTFNALAFNITFRREQGLLKRALGTPLPLGSYFAGFIGNSVANAFAQVGLVVVIGHVAYDVTWPQNWPALIAFTAAGVVCFGALGVALANVIPGFDAAPAYVNAIFLPAIFISGVFYSSDSLPRGLEATGEALPLHHVVDGLSGAIVTGDWHGGAFVVVGLWAIAGTFLAIKNFRWE